ncbi:MAG: 16S rRNA (uracil(1498)-N(3))-methyltransferase [Clostridia bacterium]|nr:16S rRNA (uracil(1498)-N(3))-methyltransferase [Clostridia bacterium]
MPKFFVPTADVVGSDIYIRGDDARHIALSLRMAVGETIQVCDFSQSEYTCTLTQIKSDLVVAHIIETFKCQTEPPSRIILYQALPKGDKMDTIVQKSVECGVYKIVPFLSERCISRPDEKSMEKKLARWQKISKEAAMQCGRGVIPELSSLISFERMLDEDDGDNTLKLFCYEGDRTLPLTNVLDKYDSPPDTIKIIIGGEGGFSKLEAEKAISSGFIPCGLGKRILRCETAAPFTLACLAFKFEI